VAQVVGPEFKPQCCKKKKKKKNFILQSLQEEKKEKENAYGMNTVKIAPAFEARQSDWALTKKFAKMAFAEGSQHGT
jgi:RecA-family ATPase